VYVINLDESKDRLANITRSLALLGVPFERIPAVAGARLPSRVRDEFLETRRGCRLTPGEIGCFLSHHLAWQTLLSSGQTWATILEDDAVISPMFGVYLSQFPEMWPPALIKIETFRAPIEIGPLIATVANLRVCELRSEHKGTAGYTVHRQTAALLLEATANESEPIDAIFTKPYIARREFRPLQLVPALVMQNAAFASDIGPLRRPKKARANGRGRNFLRAAERQIRKAVKRLKHPLVGTRSLVVPFAEMGPIE